MTRSSILATAAMALTLTLGAGCDNAADEQRKANTAQAEADRKIAEANQEAITQTTSAQLEADKKIAAAEGNFGRLREDYRHKIQSDLVELDNKIELLEAKSRVATGKAKTKLTVILPQIRTRREGFRATFEAVETATAVQWDSAKARVDKEWVGLEAMVDKAN